MRQPEITDQQAATEAIEHVITQAQNNGVELWLLEDALQGQIHAIQQGWYDDGNEEEEQ